MRFQCTNCYSVVSIDDSEAGQAVACGQCGSVIVVPRHPTAAGAVIGDFVIEKDIAKGGLATVYLAHQISLDRPAALKILHEQHASDPDYIANFISEARAAAQLNHPNIVQAYAVGEDGGYHYFAMEFIQGTTLKNLLAHSGRLVPERCLMIATEICKALDFAWTNKQLVHRDIKPDNIIVMENGQVKLADLGLAKLGKDFLRKDESEVFGTPQYISPELLLGHAADNRSDIYSLGATLYHALTGEYPYTGNSAGELARKHVTDRLRSPKSVISELPQPVSGLIEVMMAKRPGQRYQSAAEVLQELERYHSGTPLKRKPRPEFQNPINLNKVEQELAITYTPGQGADQGAAQAGGPSEAPPGDEKTETTGPQESQRKSGGTKFKVSGKTGKRAAGGTRFKTGKKRTLRTGKTTGKDKLKSKSSSGKTGTVPDDKEKGAAESGTAPAGTGATGAAPDQGAAAAEAKPEGKKKSNTGLILGIIIVLVLLGGAGGGAFRYMTPQTEQQPQSPYTPAQQQALNELSRLLRQGAYYDTILEKAQQILRDHPDAGELRAEVLRLTEPMTEKQLRKQRKDLHERELTGWLKESRRIKEEREAAEEAARLEEIRRAKEEAARKEREREEEERRRYLAEMEKKQRALRKESIPPCREHEFTKAKLLFTELLVSRLDKFRSWAEMKKRIIELAEEAYGLVYNSGKLLQGHPIKVPGQVLQAEIVSIGVRDIKAVIRDPIYKFGERVGEEVTPVTMPIERLSHSTLLELMRAAWGRREDVSGTEGLDLRIGAYMLATGRKLDDAENLLKPLNNRDIVPDMLEELKAVRNVVDSL